VSPQIFGLYELSKDNGEYIVQVFATGTVAYQRIVGGPWEEFRYGPVANGHQYESSEDLLSFLEFAGYRKI